MPIRFNPLPPHFQIVSTSGGGGGIQTINGISPNLSNNFVLSAGPGISLTSISNGIQIAATDAAFSYKSVIFAMSPYTVLVSDYFLSVDSSAGAVTLLFPNVPVALQTWVVKDRTGNALANNVTLTTPGGLDLLDGSATYLLDDNFEAIQILANPSLNYELF